MGSCASTGVSRVSSPVHTSFHQPEDNTIVLSPARRNSDSTAKGFDMKKVLANSPPNPTRSPQNDSASPMNFGKGRNEIPLKTIKPTVTDDQLDEQCSNLGISKNYYKNMATSTLGEYINMPADTDNLYSASTPEAMRACYTRIRQIYDAVEEDRLGKATLLKNLHYAITVMESMYVAEKRRIREEDDELSDAATVYFPDEVRDWLASTFTRTQPSVCFGEQKPRFRSVANAIRAGIFVERIYRRMSSCGNLNIPPNVLLFLKTELDQWSFNAFELNDVSENHALKCVAYELFHRYDLINKFQINTTSLENLFIQLEVGYSKYGNPYHNLIHAADVMQTCHMIMHLSELRKCFTDLDVFALLFAAVIHDYEHTGTTNNFHISISSELALIYNDRGVLENHHVSAIFRLTRQSEYDIFTGLNKDQFKELRQLVIDMVLCTDMSLHFQQLKNMKSLITMPEDVDKTKALSLIVHCADIAHPAKKWPVHEKWTNVLCEEFFRQGDREKELQLPVSPLCDRNTVVVPQSQIGFIDFIVEPSFQVLGDMIERILTLSIVAVENTQAADTDSAGLETQIEARSKPPAVPRPWVEIFVENKQAWAAMAAATAESNSKT